MPIALFRLAAKSRSQTTKRRWRWPKQRCSRSVRDERVERLTSAPKQPALAGVCRFDIVLIIEAVKEPAVAKTAFLGALLLCSPALACGDRVPPTKSASPDDVQQWLKELN